MGLRVRKIDAHEPHRLPRHADGGEYWLNGQQVSDLSTMNWRGSATRRSGFVFQTFNLLPRASALHNVELPLIYAGVAAKERRAQAARALEHVGLADRMSHRPNELSADSASGWRSPAPWSNQPSILLADEPTGNLDSATGEEIMRLFRELHDTGQTIVLVTHEADIAAHAARQIHLRDGLVERDVRRKANREAIPGPAARPRRLLQDAGGTGVREGPRGTPRHRGHGVRLRRDPADPYPEREVQGLGRDPRHAGADGRRRERRGSCSRRSNPRIPRNDLTQAEASLAVAKAQLDNATAQLKRSEALVSEQIASPRPTTRPRS